MNPADESLMAQVRQGDLRKLALLFERHHRPLYNYFVHMTTNPDLSEDLVQDVFFRILRYRHTYDDARPYSAWMYQIARNVCIESSQKAKPELRLVSTSDGEDEQTEWEPICTAPGAEESLKKRQEIRLLKQALRQLPEEKREILVLSRFQNLKYEEIAEVLNCEPGAVKVRVYRAVRALGQIYSQLTGEKVS